MQQAIQVKSLCATQTKDYRVKAFCAAGSVILDCSDYDNQSIDSIELTVAKMLANKFNWLDYDNWTECDRALVGGVIKNGDHVFVIVNVPFKKEA